MTRESSKPAEISSALKEIAVIVISILLAFSLEAWWDDVQLDRDVRGIPRHGKT